MPKFKVRPGYAYWFIDKGDYAEESEIVELDHIDVGEQGWKLEPADDDAKSEDDLHNEDKKLDIPLEKMTVEQLKEVATKLEIDLGEATKKADILAIVAEAVKVNDEE